MFEVREEEFRGNTVHDVTCLFQDLLDRDGIRARRNVYAKRLIPNTDATILNGRVRSKRRHFENERGRRSLRVNLPDQKPVKHILCLKLDIRITSISWMVSIILIAIITCTPMITRIMYVQSLSSNLYLAVQTPRKRLKLNYELGARICFLAVPMLVLFTLVANRREQSDSFRWFARGERFRTI